MLLSRAAVVASRLSFSEICELVRLIVNGMVLLVCSNEIYRGSFLSTYTLSTEHSAVALCRFCTPGSGNQNFLTHARRILRFLYFWDTCYSFSLRNLSLLVRELGHSTEHVVPAVSLANRGLLRTVEAARDKTDVFYEENCDKAHEALSVLFFMLKIVTP